MIWNSNSNNTKWRNVRHHKLAKSLENSGFLKKGVSKKIQNEAKEQKVGSSLLGNMLASKGVNSAGKRVNNTWRSEKSMSGFLIPSHCLTNFEIQKYY